MDLRKLKKLIDLVQESGIGEIEITEGEEKVRISRQGPAGPQVLMAGHAMQPMGMMPAMQGGSAPAAAPAAPAPPAEPKGHALKSPMVGTFYASPEPGAEPYIRVGQRVTTGQTVCIVEAMKIMNEIEAELSGVIREVCVEDATPVEYGQVLFRVDPNG